MSRALTEVRGKICSFIFTFYIVTRTYCNIACIRDRSGASINPKCQVVIYVGYITFKAF